MIDQNYSNFKDKGFIILRNFIKDDDFDSICENLKKDILIEFYKLKKKVGGSLMGNLNVFPGSYAKIIFDKLNKKDFHNIIENITNKKFSDFDIISYETNGPLELVPGTHKENIPYWKFILKKKKYKILLANRGDILIRTSNLWHRGTKNESKEPRLLLVFILKDKTGDVSKFEFEGNNKPQIFNNFFKTSIKGTIKENLYTRFSYFYLFYRLLRSFFVKKCDFILNLLNSWKKVFDQINLIDDSDSIYKNHKEFYENRHDQSALSIICKKNNIFSLSASECDWAEFNGKRVWIHLNDYPILAKRDLKYNIIKRFLNRQSKNLKRLKKKFSNS